MPDSSALDMAAGQKTGPSLSATSDMPAIPATPEPDTADGHSQDEAAPQGETPDASAAPEPDGSDTAANPEKVKPPKGVQKRIDELTREKREAERKATEEAQKRDELERQLAERQRADVQTVQDDRPNRDEFDDPDAYTQALTEWSARKAVQEDRIQRAESEQKARVQESYAKVTKDWNEGREKALEKYPDYVEVAENDQLPIAQHVGFALLSHENGHDIAYYLGKHPDEAARLSALSPLQSALAIGALGMRLSQQEKPEVSRAPAPAKPIGARGSVTKTPESESMDEYAARRNAELRKASR